MLVDGLELSDGSVFINLTVASGLELPSLPNQGELFFKLPEHSLYVYGTDWVCLGASVPGESGVASVAGKTGVVVLSAADVSGLGSVAYSNDYNDLLNTPSIPSPYVLPTATSSTLGGVKQGTNITIAEDGTISSLPQSLATARAITLAGAVTGTALFDGAADLTINTSLAGDKVGTKTFSGPVSCNYTNDGSYIMATVTGATVLSITGVPNDGKAYGMTFELTNAGSYITWPASVSWLGSEPLLRPSGISMVTLTTTNGGTSWLGSAV